MGLNDSREGTILVLIGTTVSSPSREAKYRVVKGFVTVSPHGLGQREETVAA